MPWGISIRRTTVRLCNSFPLRSETSFRCLRGGITGSTFGGSGDSLKVFNFDPKGRKLATSPSSQSPSPFGPPGTTPSISAKSNANGIVWALQTDAYGLERSGCSTRLQRTQSCDRTLQLEAEGWPRRLAWGRQVCRSDHRQRQGVRGNSAAVDCFWITAVTRRGAVFARTCSLPAATRLGTKWRVAVADSMLSYRPLEPELAITPV